MLPKRAPADVPDLQLIVHDDVDRCVCVIRRRVRGVTMMLTDEARNFISYLEKIFRERGLRTDATVLNPRIPVGAVVGRHVSEGVLAVSTVARIAQLGVKIPLQIFDRSRGQASVRFEGKSRCSRDGPLERGPDRGVPNRVRSHGSEGGGGARGSREACRRRGRGPKPVRRSGLPPGPARSHVLASRATYAAADRRRRARVRRRDAQLWEPARFSGCTDAPAASGELAAAATAAPPDASATAGLPASSGARFRPASRPGQPARRCRRSVATPATDGVPAEAAGADAASQSLRCSGREPGYARSKSCARLAPDERRRRRGYQRPPPPSSSVSATRPSSPAAGLPRPSCGHHGDA